MIIKCLELEEDSVVAHVGSGCGTFCHLVCLKTKAKAVGLDSSRQLVKLGKESAKALGIADRCVFECGRLTTLVRSWFEKHRVTHVVCFDECLDQQGWNLYQTAVRNYINRRRTDDLLNQKILTTPEAQKPAVRLGPGDALALWRSMPNKTAYIAATTNPQKSQPPCVGSEYFGVLKLVSNFAQPHWGLLFHSQFQIKSYYSESHEENKDPVLGQYEVLRTVLHVAKDKEKKKKNTLVNSETE